MLKIKCQTRDLFIKASFTESSNVSVSRPVWNKELCTSCGKCSSVCKYNAIAQVRNNILIFSELCHSCGACVYLCPHHALKNEDVIIGTIQMAPQNMPFAFGHGCLKIGESLSPIIIKKLKQLIDPNAINIIDASPGTTCPVVKSMEGMDYCLLVTEPTPFGLHDLTLAAALTEKLNLPTGIIINRSYNQNNIIEEFAKNSNIPIVGKIPFNIEYAKSYSSGELLIKKHPELKEVFSLIYNSILQNKKIPKIAKTDEIHIDNELTFVDQPDNTSTKSCKEIVVISGKGGSGKTTITSALSELMQNKVLADNDVDASNLYLLCHPTILKSCNFAGGKKYIIDQNKCTSCGACATLCHFDAVELCIQENEQKFKINPFSCEGCGFCYQVCKANAITCVDSISGQWYLSKTKQGYLSHAKLGIGEENSGKLVSLVRNNAHDLAESSKAEIILSDGPPGVGCPVISSITGADLALIITEPTLSGVHDMKRALDLTKHFNIKTLIVINKFDLNQGITDKIFHIAKDYQSEVIGKIPFDKGVNDSLIKGETIIAHGAGPAYNAILDFWNNLQQKLLLFS